MFLNESLCKFGLVESDFHLIFCFYFCLYASPQIYLLFFIPKAFTQKYNFLYQVLCTLYSIDVVSTFLIMSYVYIYHESLPTMLICLVF